MDYNLAPANAKQLRPYHTSDPTRVCERVCVRAHARISLQTLCARTVIMRKPAAVQLAMCYTNYECVFESISDLECGYRRLNAGATTVNTISARARNI